MGFDVWNLNRIRLIELTRKVFTFDIIFILNRQLFFGTRISFVYFYKVVHSTGITSIKKQYFFVVHVLTDRFL